MPEASIPRMITALFLKPADAHIAYDWLKEQCYTPNEISLLMSDTIAAKFHGIQNDDKVKEQELPSKGSTATGVAGVAIGAGVAGALAAGASIILAGFGFITAGPLGAALAASIPGALVGGLVGGLVGYGFPEAIAKEYEQAVKDGAIAISVNVKTRDDMPQIEKKFGELHARQIVLV